MILRYSEARLPTPHGDFRMVVYRTGEAAGPNRLAIWSDNGGGPAQPLSPLAWTANFQTALPNGWTHELTQWTFPACPGVERVTIFPSLAGAQEFVDQVVIDTLCAPVPAPGAAALLGIAGLVTLRRRR